MAEMAGKDKCYFLKEKIYWYRIHKDNDTFTNDEERTLITTNDISFRPEYPKKTKEQLINWECDWS
jgi:hypothetical protein